MLMFWIKDIKYGHHLSCDEMSMNQSNLDSLIIKSNLGPTLAEKPEVIKFNMIQLIFQFNYKKE